MRFFEGLRRIARLLSAPMGIVLLYFVVQCAGLKKLGLTDDDDFYIPAGISYVRWWSRVLQFRTDAFSKSAIDQAFQVNHEHPPFAKLIYGICHHAFAFLGPADGARMGSVLFSTVIAAAMVWMCMRFLGRRGFRAALLACFLLLTMPRFYFHSHAATLDIPVAAMIMVSTAVALAAERSTKAGWFSGPVFGLALSTKLNAPFFLIGYGLFAWLTRKGKGARAPGWFSLPPLPLGFISMLVLGPVIFFLSWPWLWSETTKRLGEYLAFHLRHYGIYFLYFGQVYTKDPSAPWHAPFVMALTTVPLVTSALACIGIAFAIPVIRHRLRHREDLAALATESGETFGLDSDARRAGDLLLMSLLQALCSVAPVAFWGGPKYGGEKLIMPFFPFLALLGGYGGAVLWERLSSIGRKRSIALVAFCGALGSNVALQRKFGEYALSEYNGLVDGLRGATALGFERQYYDVAHRDLVEWLNQEAPAGTKIHFLPNNWEYVRTYGWYQRSGQLRSDLRVVSSEAAADWIVLTHERRFARYGDDLFRYRGRPILRERLIDGVPIWSVVAVR